MTRENKLALVVGFGLILLVGVLISDHFSTARSQQSADLAANRPVDPLSQVRRSDPELIDLQTTTPRAGAESLRTPLAMNTTEMTQQQNANVQPPASNDVQRVIMGEPAPMLSDSRNDTAANDVSRQAGTPNVPYIFHDVKPGETMTSITQRYYDDAALVKDLAAFNGIDDPNSLRVNHRLRIPSPEHLGVRNQPSTPAIQAPTRTPNTQPTRQAEVYTTYTVKRGDTLSELSLELLGTSRRWRELYELNRDAIRDPDNLLAGTELKVPRP